MDAFGNPLKALAIGYGRRQPDPALPTQADRDKQTQTLITYTENTYTNAIDDPLLDPDNYRTPLPSEARTYELTGFTPAEQCRTVQPRRMGCERLRASSRKRKRSGTKKPPTSPRHRSA